MMKCEHCKSEACTYPDHGNGELPSMAESFARAVRERADFVMRHRERFLEAWIAETGIAPTDAVLVETTDVDRLTTTITVRPKEGTVLPNTAKALERLERLVEKHERLSHQRAVLRREVRRLNAKVAALTAVVAAWRSADGWDAVRAMAAKPIIDGTLWELRKALGLTACEVSNEDVIRAAAKRIAGGG